MTPIDFRDRLLYRGAGFGFEPVLMQSAWFRPHNKSEELKVVSRRSGNASGCRSAGCAVVRKVVESLAPPASAFASERVGELSMDATTTGLDLRSSRP